MDEHPAPKPVLHGFERIFLDKLRLAAQVILEAAPDLDLVPDPLEVELGILRTVSNSCCCFRRPPLNSYDAAAAVQD